MKQCPHCGTLSSDDKRFCFACGTDLNAAPPAPSAACATCGYPITDTQNFCPRCGAVVSQAPTPIPPPPKPKTPLRKILIPVICGVLLITIGIIIIANIADNSSSSSTYSGDYSYSSPSSSPSYSTETAATALSFTNVKIEHNTSYTVCTGTVKNNGKKTYEFVKIKGSFKNSVGTVVDTDWTYAVGAEGLAPGESATFRMSIPKDASVKSCSISLMN